MVSASVGIASATAISNDVKDSHGIVVDNPTVSKIQQAVNGANNNDNILINGSVNDTGNISCDKILTITGENCTLNNVHWTCDENMTFENITFKNCKSDYGGAIYSYSTICVKDCSFVNNTVTGISYDNDRGSAIYSRGSVTVYGSSFVGNVADDAGAIYSDKSVVVTNSCFIGNHADVGGGAVWSIDGVSVDDSPLDYNPNL